ncbi:hypothetical protein JYU34_013184 [Plutella xylostella]|uniref:Uncharacterized protein n=1 Tax=Plutella xylostella TaxID=51655 RepID=A0ABQ7QD69_PLUXY|nr:hypothetical protein JYU34_013184 [Plutella xylostella]
MEMGLSLHKHYTNNCSRSSAVTSSNVIDYAIVTQLSQDCGHHTCAVRSSIIALVLLEIRASTRSTGSTRSIDLTRSHSPRPHAARGNDFRSSDFPQ